MKKKNLIVIALVFLVAISVYLVPKAVAIFRSSASGTGDIELAKWEVSLNPDPADNSMDLVSGVTNDSYTLTITSLSEVDIDYTIVVDNLPDGVEVKLDAGTFQTPTNSKVTFSNAGSILYNDSSKVKTHI